MKAKAKLGLCLSLLLCRAALLPMPLAAAQERNSQVIAAGKDLTGASGDTLNQDDSDYQKFSEKIQFGKNEELINLLSGQPLLLRKWSRPSSISSSGNTKKAGGQIGSAPRLTLMELAVSFNNLEFIEWLFKNLPEDLRRDAKQTRLLCLAIPNHDQRTLKYLLAQGVPVQSSAPSPLATAIWLRDREAADLFMAAGARTDQFTDTALSHLEKIKKLLAERPNCVSDRDEQGRTLLHWAAVDGQCALIDLLLKNGADIDDRAGSYALTPLEVAVANNCQSAAKLLLESGAAPNGRPGDPETPLGLAAGMHSTILVNMLLDRGADINGKDGQGKTPLERALERNDEMLADYLKSRGACLRPPT